MIHVTKHHFYDPTRWRQPNIFVTFDEKERMRVKLNGSPLGTEHRILSEDRGEFFPYGAAIENRLFELKSAYAAAAESKLSYIRRRS